ncbi:hypothetical protein YWH7199_05305 [Fusobacterium nucleatum YWH7199]|nr:hypothetical protein [Fusobacterium nucleatum]MCL4577265.1 hypothetical protein [Fusobacterium nucleatum YWH7056]MCL4580880.1 hypothetical protein [Fusobacterium nucleatum YWH7199]MCL4583619.1 hypothetical protein [Fusobacterium nucleatum YWH7054]MCL4592279.1 hypothetical protein [Fusobacterium nucleatum YWH7053]
MEIRIKLQPLYRNELNFSEAFCTVPIIMDKTMVWGAYDVDLNMSEYIWCQLSEKFKEKIKNYKEHTIKSMVITVTDITAYSVSINNHEKLKDKITMEEIFKDFSESKKIDRFSCKCDFPYSDMQVYFQSLGEIYAKFELEDFRCYKKETKEEWKIKEMERRKLREVYKVEPKVIKVSKEIREREGIKERVIIQSLLEKIRDEEQSKFEQMLKKFHKENSITKESLLLIFEKFSLLIDREIDSLLFNLKYVMLIMKRAEELKIGIPENVKNEIGYWLTDMQAKIRKEEEENLFKEIRDKLNLKKIYKSGTYEFF